MGILRESPWYEEILREGEARGRAEQILSNIEMSLEAKFGSDGLELMPRIAQINDLEELQGILRSVVLANSIEELRQS